MIHKYTRDYLENVSFEKDPYKLGINSTLEELKNAFYYSDNDIKALAIYIGCKYDHPEILDLVEDKESVDIKLLAIEEAYILGNTKILEKFFHSNDKKVRLYLASLGYNLEELIKTEDNYILKQALETAFYEEKYEIIKSFSLNGCYAIQDLADKFLNLFDSRRRLKIKENFIVFLDIIHFILFFVFFYFAFENFEAFYIGENNHFVLLFALGIGCFIFVLIFNSYLNQIEEELKENEKKIQEQKLCNRLNY